MTRRSTGLVLLLFAVMFALQTFKLDSDPSPFRRFGDIMDEGYYMHNARSKVLFASFMPDQFNLAYVGAPLFTGLQYLVLSAFGVSFVAARSLSMVAFWLLQIMVFLLIRKTHSMRAAVAATVAMGTMHEMLFYARWATPLMLVLMWETAVLFLWTAKKGSRIAWPFLAGVALSMAFLSSFTAAHLLPSMVLFVVGDCYLRKESGTRSMAAFGAGVLGVMVPFALVHIGPHLSYFGSFMTDHGRYRLQMSLAGVPAQMRSAAVAPGIFRYPSAAVLLVLALSWGFGFVRRSFTEGLLTTLRDLSTVEFFSLCMIVGTAATLALTGALTIDRRTVMLVPPAFFLAVSRLLARPRSDPRGSAAGLTGVHSSHREAHPTRRLRPGGLLLAGLMWALSAYYLNAGLTSVSALMRNSFQFDASVPCLVFSFILGGVFAFLLVPERRGLTGGAFLVAFVVINLTLDTVWFATASRSVVECSRRVAKLSHHGEKITGPLSHWLALESNAHPIWFRGRLNRASGTNGWFSRHVGSSEFLLVNALSFDNWGDEGDAPPGSRGIVESLRKRYIDLSDVKHLRRRPLLTIGLCPYPFSRICRFTGTLYRVD